MVSRSSEPTGSPRSVRSQRSWRAMRRPLLMWKLPSMSGSLMRPFQPTVVRGFSLWKENWSSYKYAEPKKAIILQVGSHDNLQIRELRHFGPEEFGILEGFVRVVNRAWTDDDQETVVVASDDSCRGIATFGDGFLGSRR